MRIRREHKKTENHKKQPLATLKGLKRGDDNELERNLKLEIVVYSEQLRLAVETEEERRARQENVAHTAQFGNGDGQRKKIRTGEDGSYAQLMLALTKGVVNVGVVLSLSPF